MTPDDLPRNEAAIWLRQAAEKAVKAYLTFHQIPFRKTHNLTELGSQCARIDPALEPILREAASLSDYAYPRCSSIRTTEISGARSTSTPYSPSSLPARCFPSSPAAGFAATGASL